VHLSKSAQSVLFFDGEGSPTQCGRRQQREDNTVAGLISLENFTLDEWFARFITQLIPHLFLRFTKSQSLWLREEVAEQDTVMFGVRDGIMRSCRSYEVRGN
jgi:hypothetical protein